jgi:cation diffusion facilitator family transporter
MEDKNKSIKTAAIIALAGNAVLALLKIGAGLISKSGALIGDGIDSSSDVLVSVVALFIVRIISKPADDNHPWGHGRAETIATAFLSFLLFFMGAQLILNSATKLISGEVAPMPSGLAIIVSLVSIAGKILLAWSQHYLGKCADSAMIKANAKNMASDVILSVGVLIGLAISTLTGSGLADTIIAALVGAWVIKTAFGIFQEASLELMDGSEGTQSYKIVFEAVNAVKGAERPHRARMRRVAGFWDIDIDIEVDPNLTVLEAHEIATNVELEIKRRLESVFDIIVHVEPLNDDSDEEFGLSENS